MKINKVMQANSKELVREYAIKWQNWSSEQNLSYSELLDWSIVFDALGARYDIKDELIENGII